MPISRPRARGILQSLRAEAFNQMVSYFVKLLGVQAKRFEIAYPGRDPGYAIVSIICCLGVCGIACGNIPADERESALW